MFYESQSDALASVIEDGERLWNADQWRALISDARRYKPPDYDDVQILLRHHYENRFGPHLDGIIAMRFPHTGIRFPKTPFGWARLWAENAASVFDFPPTLFLENEDGERITEAPPDDDETDADDTPEQKAADQFATMCEESTVQLMLAEAERRAAIAGDCFVRIDSDVVDAAATGDPPVTRICLFWPNDMLVIPHPRSPGSLASAVAIIARTAGDDGVGTVDDGGRDVGYGPTGAYRTESRSTYEAWTRSYEDGPNGVPVFSPWRCDLVTQIAKTTQTSSGQLRTDYEVEVSPVWSPTPTPATETSLAKPANPYPHKRAPWIAVRSGLAGGTPFVDPNRNLVPLFDTVNAMIASGAFGVDMGSASTIVRKTDAPAPSKVGFGPGLMVNIKKSDDITVVTPTTDFNGINGSISGLLAMLAITGRQPIGSFSIDATTAPKSGTALRIEREPQTKQRLESVARMRRAVKELLVIMCEIHDEQRQTKILAPGRVPCFEPQDPPEYEDLAATQKRGFELYGAGLMTGAALLVMCRVARDEQTAKAMIAKAEEEGASMETTQVTQQRAFQLYDAGKITSEMLLVMSLVAPDEEVAKEILAAAETEKAGRTPSAAITTIDAMNAAIAAGADPKSIQVAKNVGSGPPVTDSNTGAGAPIQPQNLSGRSFVKPPQKAAGKP